jgi:hypothetical protein
MEGIGSVPVVDALAGIAAEPADALTAPVDGLDESGATAGGAVWPVEAASGTPSIPVDSSPPGTADNERAMPSSDGVDSSRLVVPSIGPSVEEIAGCASDAAGTIVG